MAAVTKQRGPLELETLDELAAFLFGPDVSPWYVNSLPEVAAALGISISTANRWSAEGMPGETGKWNLALITRWSLSDGGPRRSERYIRALQSHARGEAGE